MATEPLLSGSTVWLFGRVMRDIVLAEPPDPKPEDADSEYDYCGGLIGRLSVPEKCLARIYGFAYQNEYFDLRVPSIFVVKGAGQEIKKTVGRTGLAAFGNRFADDLRVWAYDKDDMSVRLDVTAGRFEQILLDVELVEDSLQDFVRGTSGVGLPSNLGGRRGGRARRWRSDDE